MWQAHQLAPTGAAQSARNLTWYVRLAEDSVAITAQMSQRPLSIIQAGTTLTLMILQT